MEPSLLCPEPRTLLSADIALLYLRATFKAFPDPNGHIQKRFSYRAASAPPPTHTHL